MKTLSVILGFLTVSVNIAYAQLSTSDNCEPSQVREWMVQRQLGRNQLQPFFDGQAEMELLDAILLVQEVRRDLEQLERPSCADDLYILTIYLYDTLTDGFALGFSSDLDAIEAVLTPRYIYYSENVDVLYAELEEIAGIDVMAEAAELEAIPTPMPTTASLETIELRGEGGGTVEGPLEIPEGLYLLTLTSDDGVSADIQAVSGNCSGYIFTSSQDNDKEEIFNSRGCRALIEVSSTDGSWSLTFEPVE